MQTDAPPPQRFYLLKVADETGTYYVLCQALVEVDEQALPGAVRSAVDEEFRTRAADLRVDVCEIANPSEDRSLGWIALQTKVQVKPGPGGGG